MPISDPRDISGLVVWYSAEAETGYANNAEMTQWTDLSGNGNHATPVGGLKPQWQSATGSGGGPAVHFIGTGDTLQGGTGASEEVQGYFALPTNLMSSATAGEILFNVRRDTAVANPGTAHLHAFSNPDYSFYLYTGTHIYDAFGSTVRKGPITPTMTTDVWRRLNIWSAPSDWALRLDTVSQSSTASNTVGWFSSPAIGAGATTGGIPASGSPAATPFKGWVSAVVLYNRKLTTAERADLDAWLVANPSGGSVAPAAGSVSLTGTTQENLALFNLAAVLDVALSGTAQANVAAFNMEAVDPAAALDATLAGTMQRESSAFDVTAVGVADRTISLAGTVPRQVADFKATALASVAVAGTIQAPIAQFTTYVVTPVAAVPILAAGHAVVFAQAFGVQSLVNGTQPVYTISQAEIPRATTRILMGNKDVTFWRNTLTPLPRYTLVEPMLYGPATIDFPQVAACFGDEPGQGELWFMHPGATVEVQRVVDGVVVDTDYKGVVTDYDISGRDLTVNIGGELQGRAELVNRQPVIFPRINDLGHQIADSVRDLGLPHYPPLGAVTGIETMTTGGTGHLEHLQALVAKAHTRSGRQWTVMPDPATGVYETHRKDTTTINGTVFLDDARTVANLRRDISEEPNRIFVTCVTPRGQRVRFGVYPGLVQGRVPDFPGSMFLGDTGEGVRLLIGKLHAVGYMRLKDVAGGYDDDVMRAVMALQADAGLYESGEVNEQTWNALYDLNVTGQSLQWANILPAAQRSKVRKFNRTASGTILEFNPDYEPERLVRDRNIDLGAGVTRDQAREFAKTVLHDSDDPNWTGTITFHTGALIRGAGTVGMAVTTVNVMDARELKPGMNLSLPQFAGGTVVHVAACEVGNDGTVSVTVDTRARDAMEVWEVIARNRESRNDPSRNRLRKHRSSTIEKDSIGEWDEIGGLLGIDVKLAAGWNVFQVVAAAEGTIARIKIALENEAEFACAVFGRAVDRGFMEDHIGNPLTDAGVKAWEKKEDELEERWLLYSAGTRDEPCGYWPGRKKWKSTTGEELNPNYNPDATPSTAGDQFIQVANPAYDPSADANDTGTDDDATVMVANPDYDPNYNPADHPNVTDEVITVTTEESFGTITGIHKDNAGFAYRSWDRTRVYVAVYVRRENTIPLGRIMWPQLEAGV